MVESSGGLSLTTGKLAVAVSEFAGFGLSESGGNLTVNTTAIAGNGISANSSTNVLDLDFNQVAAASNQITLAGGDGINVSGSPITVGTASSTMNLEVNSTQI